jgi:hypothetical protein
MSTNLRGVRCQKTVMLIIHTKIILSEFTPLLHLQVIYTRNPGEIKIVAWDESTRRSVDGLCIFRFFDIGYLIPRQKITLYKKYVRNSKMKDDLRDWRIECKATGVVKRATGRLSQRHWRMILDHKGLHKMSPHLLISFLTGKRNFSVTNVEWYMFLSLIAPWCTDEE